MSSCRVLKTLVVISLATLAAQAQSADTQPATATPPVADAASDARASGVLPNYRTAELSAPFTSITARQKFTIVRKITLDWPSYFTASLSSGISQLNNRNPSFGQGMQGFAHRYGASVLDHAGGNFLTEAALPILFHQDPRYFRKGTGSIRGRIAWAASRVVISRNDRGNWGFNASEFVGNGMIASLGNAYYPDARGFNPTMQRMFSQISTDALSHILKEFWPDLKKKMEQRKQRSLAPLK